MVGNNSEPLIFQKDDGFSVLRITLFSKKKFTVETQRAQRKKENLICLSLLIFLPLNHFANLIRAN